MEIEKAKAEIEKMIGISIARKVEAQGDWWAFWFGRLEAYEEVLALLEDKPMNYMHHTIVSPSNLKLAKEKGFLK